MKYEDKLWHKHDLLHDRYRSRYDTVLGVLEMLSKMQTAAKDYSRSLTSLTSKKIDIFKSFGSSLGKGLDGVQFNLSIQADEFSEMAEMMKSKVIEPVRTMMEAEYVKEKNSFNEMKKILGQYANSLVTLDKLQGKYKLSADIAEKSLVFAKQLKFSLANDIEKDRSYQKAKSNIVEAQENEKYYVNHVEVANKCRLEAIDKERNLLQMYQNFDQEMGDGIKNLICFFIATVKKMLSSILLDLESLGDKWQSINLGKDMKTFIDANASNLFPDEEIKFNAYVPSVSIDNPPNNQIEIPFEVISELKSNLKDVAPDFDLALEEKKSKIRKLSLKVFTSNNDFVFSPEEKSQLLDYCKDQTSRKIFLSTLNKQRTSGRYARSARLMKDLTDIVNTILAISEPEKDYDSAKSCIILSQTFYIEEKGSKKYLFEAIINNKWMKSKEFWDEVIERMIQKEFERNKIKNFTSTDEDTKKRISNIAFSQVLPYSNNMLDFKMDKKEILEVVEAFSKKYSIEKDLFDAIVNNVKDRKY